MMQSFTIVNVVEMDKIKYYIIQLEQFQCRGVLNVQDLCIDFRFQQLAVTGAATQNVDYYKERMAKLLLNVTCIA